MYKYFYMYIDCIFLLYINIQCIRLHVDLQEKVIYVCMYVCMYIYICICICICIYIYIYIYIRIYIYIYIYIDTMPATLTLQS